MVFTCVLVGSISAFAQHTAVFSNSTDPTVVDEDRVHLDFTLSEPLSPGEIAAVHELFHENEPIMDIQFSGNKVSISLYERTSVPSAWQKIFDTMGIDTFVIQLSPDKFKTGSFEEWCTFYNIFEK